MRRDLLLVFCLFLLAFSLPAGCGGGAFSVGTFVPGVVKVDPPSAAPGTPSYIGNIKPLRWAKQTLTLKVTGGESTVPGFNPPAIARNGAKTLNQIIGDKVLVTDYKTTEGAVTVPDVKIVFVKPSELPAGVAGRTTVTFFTSTRVVVSGRIEINRSIFPGQTFKAAAHEMGHILFCEGHSFETADLMFPSIAGETHITERDRNTTRLCYGDPPGLAPVIPGYPLEDGRAAGPTQTVILCQFDKDGKVF